MSPCTCRCSSSLTGLGPGAELRASRRSFALLLVVTFALVAGRIIKLAADSGLFTGIAVALATSCSSTSWWASCAARVLNMHVHILGICGTFMGGIAALARAAGHRVTGCDRNVYPPMSTQSRARHGADRGFRRRAIWSCAPDVFVVGNVMSRGNPLVEACWTGPAATYPGRSGWRATCWPERQVLGVAGTHGKTTTTSLLAWILEHAGLEPGLPDRRRAAGFRRQRALGAGRHFVVEGDEYDTAFFDKRAKFVHYRPAHGDPEQPRVRPRRHLPGRGVDPAAVPPAAAHGAGRRAADRQCRGPPPRRRAREGCWTPVERFTVDGPAATDWRVVADPASGYARFRPARRAHGRRGRVEHARPAQRRERPRCARGGAHAGVDVPAALEALRRFGGVRRRLEVRGSEGGVVVFDDFAHHPTAIATTLEGVRRRRAAAASRRVRAALEHDEARHPPARSRLAARRGPRVRLPVAGSRWDVAEAMRPLGALAAVPTTWRSSPPRSSPRAAGRRPRGADEQRCRSAACTSSCWPARARAPPSMTGTYVP